MHKIDTQGATADNRFTDGDPAADIEATLVSADWLNAVQGEILAVVEAAGDTPDKADNTQLRQAVQTLAAALVAGHNTAGDAHADIRALLAGINIPQASETVAGVLKLSTTDQARTGTDDTTAMSPADVAAAIAATKQSDALARDNAALNAFISWLAASRASGPVPNGYLWTFQTDEWNKHGAYYDAAGDYYAASVTIGANFLPTFTTYTMSGYTLSANQESPGYPAYNAAGTGSVPWLSGTPSGTNWLKIAFPSAQDIYSYDIKAGGTWAPKDWQLEGSNTGAFAGEQVVLDARSNITAWASGSVQTLAFECANPGTYSFMRLVITANNGNATHGGGMNGLLLRGAGAVSDMAIYNNPVTLGAVPTKATVYILHKAVDAVVLNTDIKVAASRLSGWAYATDLVDLGAYNADYKLLRATMDFSAFASGANGWARVETANTKRQHVRACLAWFE